MTTSELNINGDFNTLLLEATRRTTPFFLFYRSKIQHNYREFKRCFPGATIFYAMKANSEPEVLRILADEGCSFEVASKYELHLLQKLHVPPERIMYGSAIKPTSHLEEFVAYGVSRFAFDSLQEMEKLAAIAPGSSVYARAKVDDAGSQFIFSEKFGAEQHDLVPLLLRTKDMGLKPCGISFHVGSQASNPMAWANAVNGLQVVFRQLSMNGITLESLNIGGGFPCRYASEQGIKCLGELSRYTLEECRRLPYQPKLMLEPGRALVADTAVLVTRVIAKVKRSDQTWLFLDAGVYNALFEAMACQGSTRYPITTMEHANGVPLMTFGIAGPTGDGLDLITREALLPLDIDEGDLVCIHKVGAYTLAIASSFNGFPRPDVHIVD